MQEKQKDFDSLVLQDYVKNLTEQERIRLKSFVATLFGKSYLTINDKFSGRRPFSPAELLALQPIIEKEQWKEN